MDRDAQVVITKAGVNQEAYLAEESRGHKNRAVKPVGSKAVGVGARALVPKSQKKIHRDKERERGGRDWGCEKKNLGLLAPKGLHHHFIAFAFLLAALDPIRPAAGSRQ